MSGFKNGSQRGGKNHGTVRYCPRFNGLMASDPRMSLHEENDFWSEVQKPSQLLAMAQAGEIRYDQLDPEDWVRIEDALHNRRIFERSLEVEAENKVLKAKIAALEAENAALKSQQSSPPAPQILGKTGYRDAVAISPATIQKRKLANFSRRVRLYFILLDTFNRKLDDDEAEIEGCGSVLRKIFELVTNISADISENTLTIPDLDFKFYGSKEDFETFAKKVSEWISENELGIPETHFIIGKMYRFTAKKTISSGQIVEYEKFTLEVIDFSTKEIFMIDIMNVDGSAVFPCDFSVNSLAVSPKRGIYAKDPLHRKGKFNFLGVIHDIFSGTTTCMTKSSWKFEKSSLIFQVRQIKMLEAGYEMQGAPVLRPGICPVMCDDALCVSLTGCRCKDTKGAPIPVMMSIYAAIGIYDREKRCPNCRDILKEFVCSAVESIQSMCEPKKLTSKAEFELLVERAERMCQGYSFSGLAYLSEESKDSLRTLSDFSRKNREQENDDQMRAGGGAAAAPVPAPPMRAGGGAAAAPVPAPPMRAEAEIERDFLEAEIQIDFLGVLLRLRLEEQAQARAAAAPVPAPPMRAGGGAAAAPLRRRQYDSDGEYGYIRRYGS